MNKPRITSLPYRPDSASVFASLAERPWAVFLDSGRPFIKQGRYDIISAFPRVTLTTWGEYTEIKQQGRVEYSRADPFALVQRFSPPTLEEHPEIPFCAGALGWFGYDLARRLENLPVIAADREQLPDMAIGIYAWALIIDHQKQRACLTEDPAHPLPAARRRFLLNLARQSAAPPRAEDPLRLRAPLQSDLSRAAYAERFHRIQAYIRAGDCYQVNFAQGFSAPATGNPWHSYLRLRRLNPAPFGAYLNIPPARILCSSPERFLAVRNGRVQTRPIKGTRPRGADAAQDEALRHELLNSPKDRAENLMIVDLLRNDLGKVCRIGSIRVPALFELESFAAVHHLVSTVSGVLRPECGALDLLRACFPGGSITGAPKLRAMQIIEELEPRRRGIYCGSIAYFGRDGNMDSNIVIRTLVYSHGCARFRAGGGIVADSMEEAEYQESLDKAAAMIELLGASGEQYHRHNSLNHEGYEGTRRKT